MAMFRHFSPADKPVLASGASRERRNTIRYRKPAANSAVHLSGYLFKRSDDSNRAQAIHKQYFFVLTEESLTFYRKKNDSRPKGEIHLPVKLEALPKYEKKHAFQLTPLRFDRVHVEFIPDMDSSIVVHADNAQSEKEWRSKIESITRHKMEPYIFPDGFLDDPRQKSNMTQLASGGGGADGGVDDGGTAFNAIQQQMHDKLGQMLGTNYFNLSSKKSKWRSSLSLRALRSTEAGINELNKSLRIGECPAAQNNILSATCLKVHNSHNLMVVGSRPDHDSNTDGSSYNGELQIYNCTVSEHERDEPDISLLKKWQISDGIVSMDWRENILLVATNEGRVYYYQIDVQNESTIYLVAHNETNPMEPVVFSHNALQQQSKYTLLSAPGSWMHSLRIHEVAISAMKQPDCFLCIENESFHLWSLDSRGSTSRPVYSQKASASPLFCVAWNPHHNHQFMVGGVSTNLKIIDSRQLTTQPSKSVPWKVKKAHEHSIGSISWHPLVEYWIATGSDDGCVKVWDIRYNGGEAVRTLQQHNNVVNCVQWSGSHCELLLSGSDDRTMKLWNLRAPACSPHHLVYSHLYAHPVIGCGVSPQRPMQFFGLSSAGELQSVELQESFVADFVPHRFTEKSFEKRLPAAAADAADANHAMYDDERMDFEASRDIERMIYMRDMAAAHGAIPALADKQWRKGNYEHAQDLLNLVSMVGFQSTLAKYHKQYNFNEMLNKVSPFYHPHCVVLSTPNAADVSLCEQMKLRMFIRKVLTKKEWKKLLIMKEKIFKHLMEMSLLLDAAAAQKTQPPHAQAQKRARFFSNYSTLSAAADTTTEERRRSQQQQSGSGNDIFVAIIELLKQYCYVDSVKWCLAANDVYHQHNEHRLFVPIAVHILYPTIFHFADDTIVKSPDPTLLRRSAHILGTKLRDYEFMRWQLQLMLRLHECVQTYQYEQVPLHIIKVWKAAHKSMKNKDAGDDANDIDANDGDKVDTTTRSRSTVHGQQQQAESEEASIVLNIDENITSNFSNISQSAFKLYFNALLSQGLCDEFFIECTRLCHQNKGYEMSYIITDMMDNEGYTELQSYLDKPLAVDADAEAVDHHQLRQCCDAVCCMVNICENCPELPKCLKNNLPKYLKQFQMRLETLFKAMQEHQDEDMKQRMISFGRELVKRIKNIQNNKLNTQYFFRNEIHNLQTMVQQFCW